MAAVKPGDALMYIAERFADYALNLHASNIPGEVLEHAKTIILDTLGCGFGGFQTTLAEPYLKMIKSLHSSGDATVLGAGLKVPPPAAAYANGYLIAVLEIDDTIYNLTHLGSVVIPAAFAVAESADKTGADILEAIVAGYDVAGRVGLAVQPGPERFKKVWGLGWISFGAAVAAGKLLDLTRDELAEAIGIAGTYTPVPNAWKYFERPMRTVKMGWGWYSFVGVWAAMSAKAGLTGNKAIFEGDDGWWAMYGSDQCDFGEFTRELGREFVIGKSAIRVYPSCRWTHTPLDGVREIYAKNKLKPDEIKEIKIKGVSIISELADYEPRTLVDAEFSMPYTAAVAALGIHPGPPWFSSDKLQNSEVLSLAKKVKIETDPESDRMFREKKIMPSTVAITTKNGRIYSARVVFTKGETQNPFSRSEVVDKFHSLSQGIISSKQRNEIARKVENFEKLSTIDELVELCIASEANKEYDETRPIKSSRKDPG